MRVKVVKNYVDKYTRLLHSKGTEAEMTKGRFDEIALSGHYVEEIKEKETGKKKVR